MYTIFNYTDHLGNVRVTYKDDGSGIPYVVEEENYYPFGFKHTGYNETPMYGKDWGSIIVNRGELNYRYKYNGKEFQDELGLNMYDYGARLYDPARAGWSNIDPLAEKMRRFSPYNYCFNNPLRFTDPDGMAPADWILPKNEAERKLALQALNELKNSSPKAKAYVERVENDKNNHVELVVDYNAKSGFTPINYENAKTSGKGSGGTLVWNPKETTLANDKMVDGTKEVPVLRPLLEEVIHASRAVGGETATGDSKANLGEGWKSNHERANEEIETNAIVNESLVEMGLSEKQRTTYSMNFTKYGENEEGEEVILGSKFIALPIPIVNKPKN